MCLRVRAFLEYLLLFLVFGFIFVTGALGEPPPWFSGVVESLGGLLLLLLPGFGDLPLPLLGLAPLSLLGLSPLSLLVRRGKADSGGGKADSDGGIGAGKTARIT